MAQINPRVVVVGAIHRVTPRTFEANGDRAAKTVADVLVLTDGGGLAEIRLDEPTAIAKPEIGDRVAWSVDVAAYKSERGAVWLSMKYAEAYEVPASSAPLHAVNE